MTTTTMPRTLKEIAERAPLPKSFYDRFDSDELRDFIEYWPSNKGYVCVLTNSAMPGQVRIASTPDLGLLECLLERESIYGAVSEIARSSYVDHCHKAAHDTRAQLQAESLEA